MFHIKNHISDLFHNCLEFLFPPVCPLCQAPVSIHGELCASCWANFNWISDPKCYKCGYPFPASLDLGMHPLCPGCASGKTKLDFIRAACCYDDISKCLVLPFKYAYRLDYTKFMSRAMMWALRDLDLHPDIIIPVPLANRRLWRRGYNQATLLARPIARVMNVKLDIKSVHRKYRVNMGHMNEKERAKNIRGVFKIIHPDKIKGRKILLIDDVMTTGATLSELCRALKRAGADEIYGLVFSRVIRTI